MEWVAAIKLAIKAAKSKMGEKLRRYFAQNSADELRRRQREEDSDDDLNILGV